MTLPHFSSKAFLAPMAGVSDPALRIMCKKMGAGLVVTELTSVNAIVAKQKQLQSEMKDITNFIEFSEMGFTEFLSTDVNRDGTLQGPDLDLEQINSLKNKK